MNITKTILDRMGKGQKLIETICEVVEASDLIDYDDVADAIKGNPTMIALLEREFKSRNMLPPDAEEVNLTEIFKGL